MLAEGEQTVEYFSNQAIFSDHYLAERMDAHPEWAEDISDAFAQLQGLYRAKQDILDSLNEAQTEAEFIQPALEILGFAYIPQAGFTQAGRQLRPDYALFADEAAKTEVYRFLRDEGKFYPRALAICDAKYWGRPLDVKREADPRDEFKNTNPSFQIVNYLVGTDVDWGILTNGRLWRLYYQKARSRASTYYEVDLELILEREDHEAFRYFYHFFRQEALVKDPATDRSFLERIYEESVTYALQVQEELKGLIFEKIVPILAEGFVAWRRTELGITHETRDSLHQIFTATLTLLYRLLFLLYAESRELLPVSDRLGYYRYSLTRLKREAMARRRREEVFSTVSDDLWNDLAALFRIIDRGDPALSVPTYNGGLFDRRSLKNAFLEEHRIADAYLVLALDLLTRRDDPGTGDRRFIDYKDLDVRHLGSIYEGLLEFYLRIAQEDLTAVKERGVEVYKPLSEVGESRRLGVIRQGELYLENDKGQRKATGSYYTPDYIVKYIVANTLGPIMDEREAAFAEAMAEWEAYQKKLVRAERRAGAKMPRRELEQLEAKATGCLLDIKVCDPAMGSGHFLVEAVAYLTDHIIDILNQHPENPVLARLAAIRKQILANLEEQGIRVDPAVLTDTNLLKRMVMKRCIYGVDLNPMAVELAKLSLWLDSFTVGAPLSFLDHHLKVGNSLIGARVQEVRAELEKTAIGQYEMFGGPFAGLLTATELMRGVGLRTDATFAEVQESAELYAGFERAILPYKRVLDLWVSKHFGNERAEELLRLYGIEALQAVMNEGEGLAPEYQQAIETARQLWEDKRFFHWDLEFPEVFIDLERSDWKQNPGFDVVVGNPPYERIQTIQSSDPILAQYYESTFRAGVGKFDIYVLFVERACEIQSRHGTVGFILPHKFTQAHFGKGIREHIWRRSLLRQIYSFGTNQVFPEVTTYTCLLFLQESDNDTWQYYEMPDVESNANQMRELLFSVMDSKLEPLPKSSYTSKPWILGRARDTKLVAKLQGMSWPLKDIAAGIFQGVVTGMNDVFILEARSWNSQADTVTLFSSQTQQEVEIERAILKPFAKGEDIARYRFVRPTRFLLYPYKVARGVELYSEEELRTLFPKAYEYLQANYQALSQRGSERMEYESWYALWNPRSPQRFACTKILTPDICYQGQMTITEDESILHADTTYAIIPRSDLMLNVYALLSILNSRLMWFFLTKIGTPLRGGYYRYKTHYLERFPIRRIEFTTPERKRREVVERLKALYREALKQDTAPD